MAQSVGLTCQHVWPCGLAGVLRCRKRCTSHSPFHALPTAKSPFRIIRHHMWGPLEARNSSTPPSETSPPSPLLDKDISVEKTGGGGDSSIGKRRPRPPSHTPPSSVSPQPRPPNHMPRNHGRGGARTRPRPQDTCETGIFRRLCPSRLGSSGRDSVREGRALHRCTTGDPGGQH